MLFGLTLLSIVSVTIGAPQTPAAPKTNTNSTIPAGMCHCFTTSKPEGVPECSKAICDTYPGKSEANCKAITGTWAPAGAVDGKCTDPKGIVVPPL
jgi:hypothetical protein